MVNYPVGDFLIQVKNASLARRKEVPVASNGEIKAVAAALKKAGFLEDYSETKGNLIAKVAYRAKRPVLLGLKLVSTPGLRIYMGVKDLEKKRGPSIFLISSPEGVTTSREAIKRRLGGEVIAEVW